MASKFDTTKLRSEARSASSRVSGSQMSTNRVKTLETDKQRRTTEHNDDEDLANRIKILNSELKHVALSDQPTVVVSKQILAQLELDLAKAKLHNAKVSNIFAELKKAEQVDVCFMLDCTGSMAAYIDEAKTLVHHVVDKLSGKFKDLRLRCAFVGYRDHSDGEQRITHMAFSSRPDEFKAFVSEVEATGGDDQCEDVFGGLECVNSLDWV